MCRFIAAVRTTLIVVLAGVSSVACNSGPQARVDKDSHANFANYKTFAWLEQTAEQTDETKVPETLSEQRVRSAITTVLQGKGYTLDETHPDVRVHGVLNVYERPKQSGVSIGLGAGGGSGNVSGGVGVSVPIGKRRETVAAMKVDVIDTTRNEQVWFGSAEQALSGTIASDADIQALTEAILAKYPTAGKM